MTTDELRTWMKALEERDMRIVALEKRLAALCGQVARIPGQGRIGRPKAQGLTDQDWKATLDGDDGKPLSFNPEHSVHALEAAQGRGPQAQLKVAHEDGKPTLSCPELGTMSLEGASPHMVHVAQETLSNVLTSLRKGRPPYYEYGYPSASCLADRLKSGPRCKTWRCHVLVWACYRQGLFTATEVEALKGVGWGQWLR